MEVVGSRRHRLGQGGVLLVDEEMDFLRGLAIDVIGHERQW